MRKVQKEFVTEPTKQEFFNLFFKSKSVTLLIGYFGQLVSGVTEFHFVFTAANGHYEPFLIWLNFLPIVLGLIVVYLFEVLGVRVYLVRIVRQIANGQFKQVENWILFSFNLLFVVSLCGANIWFSMLGQKASFHNLTNVSVTDKTFGLDSVKLAKLDNITQRYETKETDLRTDYAQRQKQTILHYDGMINEFRTNRWTVSDAANKTKYNRYTHKIDKAVGDKTTAVEKLDGELNAKLNVIYHQQQAETERVAASFNTRIDDITKTEKSNINLWAMIQEYTLPILIGFIMLSWLSIIYTEVFFKGAGQQVKVQKLSHRPFLLVVLFSGLYDKLYHSWYKTVVKWIGLDKYQYSTIRTNEIEYKAKYAIKSIEEQATEQRPAIAAKRTIGFKDYGNTKPKDKISNTTNENTIKNTSTANGENTVPVGYQVEFEVVKNYNNGDRNNGDRCTLASNERICKHCGTTFQYKHWNKRYCSDDCRVVAWEKRTGRKLQKGRKK